MIFDQIFIFDLLPLLLTSDLLFQHLCLLPFAVIDSARQCNFSQGISSPRPSCYCGSQVSNSSVSTKVDVTSRVRLFSGQAPQHILRWLYEDKQYKVVYTQALSPPVPKLPLVIRGWHTSVLSNNMSLTCSSITTKEWKIKIKSPSRMTPELVGLNLKSW